MLKQESTSANLLLGVLAVAKTNSTSANHVLKSTNEDQFLLHDVNRLITHAKRINTAWNQGTPLTQNRGVTDLLISPEIMGEIRSMAYNPINTRGLETTSAVNIPAGTDTSGGSTTVSNPGAGVIPATEQMRNALYQNAGASELYGLTLTELNELGKGQRFNNVFDSVLSSGNSLGHSGDFNKSTDELIIGIDKTRESLMRAVATDSETGAELRLMADDQYSVRQSKIGYYGAIEEGRMILDARVLTGIVV